MGTINDLLVREGGFTSTVARAIDDSLAYLEKQLADDALLARVSRIEELTAETPDDEDADEMRRMCRLAVDRTREWMLRAQYLTDYDAARERVTEER